MANNQVETPPAKDIADLLVELDRLYNRDVYMFVLSDADWQVYHDQYLTPEVRDAYAKNGYYTLALVGPLFDPARRVGGISRLPRVVTFKGRPIVKISDYKRTAWKRGPQRMQGYNIVGIE